MSLELSTQLEHLQGLSSQIMRLQVPPAAIHVKDANMFGTFSLTQDLLASRALIPTRKHSHTKGRVTL